MHLRLPRAVGPSLGVLFVILSVAALLLSLFLYSLFQTTHSTATLTARETELAGEVAVLRRQRAELEGLRAYLASDEYIEAVARQQFGLVRPGETAVDVQAPSGAPVAPSADERWWESAFRP